MVIGHEKIINVLTTLAREKALGQAYLFWGSNRVGKKTVARELASRLEGHTGINDILFDFLLIESGEKGTISIDAIRQVSEFFRKKPAKSVYRTVVINDAHRLTTEAQNALLKTSEDTPQSGLLIVITGHPESLRSTLVSRLQKIYFAAVSDTSIDEWLQEMFRCSAEKAHEITMQSFGQPGRAYALLCDESFKNLHSAVKEFLTRSASQKKAFIQKLVKEEDFNILTFLDAFIDTLALQYIHNREKTHSADTKLWHNTLILRAQAEFFNVNPRLQLESLFLY